MTSLPSRLDSKLIDDAVKALLKYENKRSQEKEAQVLFEGRPKAILLQVSRSRPPLFIV